MTMQEGKTLNSAAVASGLDYLIDMDGVMAALIVLLANGEVLESRLADNCTIDITIAARIYAQIFRAQHKVIKVLKEKDALEDIQITQSNQYHLMMSVHNHEHLFMLVIMKRNAQATLGLLRLAMSQAQKKM